MAWEYDLNGVKHVTNKQLNEQEIQGVITQYEGAGLLDPEARKQEEASYSTNLNNKGLLGAFRSIHDRENEKAFDGTDEELTDAYYQKMRDLEGNMGSLGMLTARLSGDYYSEEEKGALSAMWYNWENTVPFYKDKDQFWQGIGDHAEAAVTDPANILPALASVATLGWGTPVAFGAKQAGVQAAKAAMKGQMSKYLGKHFAVGAKQAAPWAIGESLMRQDAKGELGLGDGITLGDTVVDATVGTAFGGALTTALGGAKLAGSKLLTKTVDGVPPNKAAGNPNAFTKQGELTPEDAAQTKAAADEFMGGMADPEVVNAAREANRDTFLNSVSAATLENIKRNSQTGTVVGQKEARDNALNRLSELGLTEWTPTEILGKLKNLPETHGNFSSFASLAVDVETAMYNNWVKTFKEGQPHMDNFALYNDAAAVASRYSGEAARALNYQKARARLQDDEFADVLTSMAATHNADEAAAAFEVLAKAKWGKQLTAAERAAGGLETAADVVSELRTYNLLSAVSTMSVNTFSGYLHMNQKWLQKSLGGATSLNGRELSEGVLQGINMHRNLVQTIPYMLRGFNSSKGYIDRPRSSVELGDRANDIGIGNRDFQIIGGGTEGMGRQEGESGQMYAANLVGNLWRALGKRGIAGTDEWIKHTQFRTEIQNSVVAKLQKDEGLTFAQAYIKSESIVNKLTKEQLDNSLAGTQSRNPMILDALRSARDVAFQNDFRNDPAGAAGKAANQLIHTGMIGDKKVAPAFLTKLVGNSVAPFIRTPSNIFSHLGEMTPALQLFSTHLKDTMAAGGKQAREMENQILFGSVVWASAATLAGMSIVQNSGAGSKGQRNVDNSVNKTGYAIVLDDGTRYNIRKGDPYARPLLIMARMKDVFEYGDEKAQSELMASLTLATVKSMAEMPTLTGVNQMAALFDEQSAGNAAQKFGTNYATSFMPYVRLVKEVLVETGNDVLIPEILDLDDVLGQPHAFNINGRPDNVKRDAIFGTPVVRNSFAFTPMSGIEVAHTSKDPVLLELKRLHIAIEAPAKSLGGVNMTEYKVDKTSNRNVYDLYQELVGTVKDSNGENLHEALATLMKDDEYVNIFNDDLLTYGQRSTGRKSKIIQDTISVFRRQYALNALKAQLGPQHPLLVEQARSSGLDVLSKAGASKDTVSELFPLNKAQ